MPPPRSRPTPVTRARSGTGLSDTMPPQLPLTHSVTQGRLELDTVDHPLPPQWPRPTPIPQTRARTDLSDTTPPPPLPPTMPLC
eukprot:855526-Prorocentrum_minimum.AAC.1